MSDVLKNMYPEERALLKERVPLSIPLCVCIEPTNICNFKCVMCFHGNNEYAEEAKPLRNMDWACFEKTIMDLKDWTDKAGEKIKLIKLYSLGEPLLHPEICNMVKAIKELNICEQIEITTNASLLTREVAERLVDDGLDILRISVYAVDEEHNKYITKSHITPREIMEKVRYIREYRDKTGKTAPQIFAKMIDTYTDENQLFLDMYRDVVDIVGIDQPFHLNSGENDVFENLYQSNAGDAFEKSMSTNIFAERKACRYPFTHMTVRNDGSVVVCCIDWLKQTCIGNVNRHSLKEIWESKTLYHFRCNMLNTKGSNLEVCKRCELPLRDLPEDQMDDFPVEKLSYQYDI